MQAGRHATVKGTQAITRALKRAATEARRIAEMHGTKARAVQDGKLVGLTP